MSLPVILGPAAQRELDDATDWYERNGGLGFEFVARVQDAIDRIGQMPESHATIHKSIRRARVPRFPYFLFYRIKADEVEVIAILHGHRDPTIWESRA